MYYLKDLVLRQDVLNLGARDMPFYAVRTWLMNPFLSSMLMTFMVRRPSEKYITSLMQSLKIPIYIAWRDLYWGTPLVKTEPLPVVSVERIMRVGLWILMKRSVL